MPLREELRHSGEWLFRHRSHLPLVALAVTLAAFVGYQYPGGTAQTALAWQLFCFAISLSGQLVRITTVGFVPRDTSGRNVQCQVAACLNTTGWYSVVRHPLYVGNYLMYLGVMMLPAVWWVPVLLTLAFWLYYERIMFAEEEFLRDKFGASYEEWASRTPAFVPRLSQWASPSMPFCPRATARRENSSVLGMLVTFAACDAIAHYAATGQSGIHPVWVALASVGTVSYLVLRVLKRRTRVLASAGR